MRIVSRHEWGARPANRVAPHVSLIDRTEFYVHYLGTDHADTVKDREDDHVRAIQAYHMDANGWDDVGYNFLVGQSGTAYEGRGRDAVGAHCAGHNRLAIGVCIMIGKGDKPSKEALHATAELYRLFVEARNGHPLAKHGHRDGFNTECPGDILYAWVKKGCPDPLADHEDKPHPPKWFARELAWPSSQVKNPGHTVRTKQGLVFQQGSDVKIVQRKVGGAVDGMYGQHTESAVKGFQRAHNLTPDGVVGPMTATKLGA